MSSRAMFIFAAISGFLLVAFGAFGAHVLSRSLGPTEMAWIHTGLEYQAYHTLAVIGLGAAMLRRANLWFYWSSAFLLYSLALSHLKFWVFVTPVGGLFFLVGWFLMLIGALRLKRKADRHE